MKLQFALQPKQESLYTIIEQSNFQWIGYGGARGGAKSHAIRGLAVAFGYKYSIQSLVFRRYRDDLLKNHVYPLLRAYPGLKQYFNKSELVLYSKKGNPLIKFDYAERDEDIEKVAQGTEYQIIFVDEATQSTEYMIKYLSTANRDSESRFPSRSKMVLTMNPGGQGHAFIKRVFIDKMYQGNELASDYCFIQAHVWDNVMWSLRALKEQGISVDEYYYKWSEDQRKDFTIKYSDYAKNLSGLPEDLKLAYLYGDWNVFGGMFFKHLNLNKQVIEPFIIPFDWELIGSIDPGFSSPCSFGLTAKDFSGNYYRIYTYYEAGKSPVEHAANIADLLNSPASDIYRLTNGRSAKGIRIVSGTDAFAKKDRFAIISNEKTFSDVFNSYGLYLEPATTDRIQGWWNWKGLIPNRYFVFDKYNRPLINEMTAVVSEPKYPEDIKGRGNDAEISDHALDEQRYGLMAIREPERIEVDPRPEWLINFENERKSGEISIMSL